MEAILAKMLFVSYLLLNGYRHMPPTPKKKMKNGTYQYKSRIKIISFNMQMRLLECFSMQILELSALPSAEAP